MDVIEKVILKWQLEIRKGFAKPLILALLEESSNYPYNLTREISARTKGQILIAGSNIYPILKNLQDDGLILGQRSNQLAEGDLGKSKGPTRTIYSLTELGKEVLNDLRKSMTDFITIIRPFIMESGEVK